MTRLRAAQLRSRGTNTKGDLVSAKWIWTTLCLAAVGAGVWYLNKKVPIAELLQLTAQGGDRILRDPMRPVRGGVRVVLFALDGVGNDEFHRAVRDGAAPKIADLRGAEPGGEGYANAYTVPDALSILPSTTMAAWSSIFTGSRCEVAG